MLTGELRDPVRRDRRRHHVLRRRIDLRVAVDRGRRGEHDTHGGAARRREDALAREYVLANVEREHVAEAAHAGLGGEVEHTVEAGEVERILGEVEPGDVEPARVRLLQSGVVIVGKAVDAERVVARGEQRVHQVRADEARGAGDDVPHDAILSGRAATSSA